MVETSVVEIIKENAFVVDSSLIECKHDQENYDDSESSINMDIGDHTGGTDGTEEQMNPSCGAVDSSHMTKDKLYTRYFVIKSLSHDNIQLSVEKGIWATQVMNEPILEEAFHNSDRVILIFSVNMSGFFQGYAQMMSSVSWKRDNVWSKSSGGCNPWGRSFKVNWIRLCDLPFQKTLHLKNPLNDYKPVKISRDCQELSADIGEALCKLFDGEEDTKGKLKRISFSMDDGLSKKSCRSSPVHFDGENSLPPEPSSHMRRVGSAMLQPSLLYQHVQHKENILHAMLGRSQRLSFHRNSYSYLDSDNSLSMNQPVLLQTLSNRPERRNEFLHSTKKDMICEEHLPPSLSEDDFLSMTYEEYLQAIGRSSFSSRCLSSASVGTTSHHTGVADK